ncbi:hypothetical protein [Streptomyces uncialis]|uniref:hypothetical protein n=1 Tax=Streptomyces uncialis TaxID=1048205 RepID=UPI002F938C87|nr:hypothetical protein OG924_37520 [Streptomyces uncialis]
MSMSTAAAFGHAVRRRARLERAVYGAAALGLAIAPNADPTGPANLLALGAAGVPAAFTVWRGWRQAESPDAGLLKTAMRGLPCATAAVLDVSAVLTSGWLLDAVLAAGWGAVMAALAPLTRAGTMHRAQLALAAAGPAPDHDSGHDDETDGDPFGRDILAMWDRAPVSGTTRLMNITRHDSGGVDFSALVKAPPGHPVPDLDPRHVAAAFGVRAEAVTVLTTGHGPGWAEIVVTPDALDAAESGSGEDHTAWWAKKIARPGKAVPGAVLEYRTRDTARGVTHYVARMEDETEAPRPDIRKLCTAVGADHEDLRVFAHVDRNRVHVMVCDIPPLEAVNIATRADVTPNAEGFWRLGVSYNGTYVNGRVHRPEGIALGLVGGVSGSGKSQLIVLCVAADANASMTSWVATEGEDGKIALLAPHVDRHGVGALYIVRMLRAAVALMDIRGAMPRADGRRRDWKPGDPGCPYRALTVYVDEYLAATKHETYGEEIAQCAELLSVKGRKYGLGFKAAGQDMKIDDGFTTTMRNQLKANSRPTILNMGDAAATRRAFDGLVAGEHIPDPLPGEYGGTRLSIEDRIAGKETPEDATGIGGVGWIVVKGKPVLMRTLYVDLSGDDAEANLAALFPATVHGLTGYEIRALEDQGLLGDWNAPDPDDDSHDGGHRAGGSTTTRTAKPAKPHRATAADKVAAFLDMVPTADRQMAIDAVTGDGITPDAAAAAYDALT